MSELVVQQLRYWNEFLAHVRRSGKDVIGARGPYKSTANELLVNVGGGDGVELRAWMDRRDGFIAVSLYLTGARKHGVYQTLLETRREIDDKLRSVRLGSPWRSGSGIRRADEEVRRSDG